MSKIETIRSHWADACDEARFTEADRAGLWHRQFLNSYSLEGHRSS